MSSSGTLFHDVTVAPGEVKDLGDLKVVPPKRMSDTRSLDPGRRPIGDDRFPSQSVSCDRGKSCADLSPGPLLIHVGT